MSNYLRLKKMLYIVSLAAVSIVIALIEIPNPFAFTGIFGGFVKLDFSDVAILVSLFVLGTKETFYVIIIRTIARRLFRGFDPGDVMGEIIAAVASISIVIGYRVALKILKIKERPLLIEVPVNHNKITLKETMVVSMSLAFFLSSITLAFNYLMGTPFYLSYFAFVGSEGAVPIHFTVFSFINSGSSFAGIPLTFSNFFWMAFASYTPFNLMKGVLIGIVFLLVKPKLKYLEL